MKAMPPNEVSVRFWGVRGSIPAPGADNLRYGGNTSCIEVRYQDQLVILDAGSGLRPLGVELNGKAQGRPIEGAVLLSHTHWDHIQGLPFFAPGYLGQNRFRLFAGPGRGAKVRQGLQEQMGPLHFPVRFEQMAGLLDIEEVGESGTELGQFFVRAFPLNHPGGCTGFWLSCRGKSIAYLPDHEPFDASTAQGRAAQLALVEFIHDVDLLILDTQYTAEEYASRHGWGHGSLPECVDLALASCARELMLFHHDPLHHDGQIDAMLAMARQRAAGTELAVNAAQEGDAVILQAAGASAAISRKRALPSNAVSV
jgi:phosphoribosyl 1,2-cyclic phosphodiesterase